MADMESVTDLNIPSIRLLVSFRLKILIKGKWLFNDCKEALKTLIIFCVSVFSMYAKKKEISSLIRRCIRSSNL